jgi:hypothetical protein
VILHQKMSYTEDAVKAKLSSLNDQQDSIVTVAQWIMFHRYAPNTGLHLAIFIFCVKACTNLVFYSVAPPTVQPSSGSKD